MFLKTWNSLQDKEIKKNKTKLQLQQKMRKIECYKYQMNKASKKERQLIETCNKLLIVSKWSLQTTHQITLELKTDTLIRLSWWWIHQKSEGSLLLNTKLVKKQDVSAHRLIFMVNHTAHSSCSKCSQGPNKM